jgi:two-component system sensor histidine kinase BaeS
VARSRSSRSGLATRLVILTTAVAGVAVLVAGLVSIGLLRGASDSEARKQLGRQADVFSVLFDNVRRPAQTARLITILRREQIQLEAVGQDGAVCRGALQLPARYGQQLVDGKDVSAVADINGHRRFIEGRPLSPESRPSITGCRAIGVVLFQEASQAKVVSAPLRDRLLIAFGIGLVGAALAGALIARRLARPLQHAAAAARALASGRRDVAVQPEGPAEVAEVAEALNGLSGALRRSEARQHDFLLSVSHELRTPLTAITGHAEALADGVITGDDVPGAGTVMLAEGRRLDRLVSDLLDLARLGAADFRIDPAPTDLAALVRGAEQVWRPRCAAEGIELRVEVPTEPLVVVTDGGRVRQILDGLAENALRVVPSGAPIVFAAAADHSRPGGVLLQVRDGGPGLTPDDCAVAFERSALYDRYRGIRRVGTGLGLALVAGLAAALGGTPHAGRAPEGGAAFTITLPPLPPAVTPPAPPPAPSQGAPTSRPYDS